VKCASTTSITASLGSIVQWNLGDGCVMTDSHGVGELFGIMAASTLCGSLP
jgi:hypothetical protein